MQPSPYTMSRPASQQALGHGFETPENVVVAYEPAGLGTRFLAWVLDIIIRTLLFIAFTVMIILTGVLADQLHEMFSHGFEWLASLFPDPEEETVTNPESIYLIALGIVTLLWGLGSFVYFFLCEYLMRGQTVGKKLLRLRVVKVDGFSLDAPSVFIRNLFRIVDEFALLWLTPLFSKRNQRFGDMAAGTMVVRDEPSGLSDLREHLIDRPQHEITFRIEGARLAQLTEADINAMEMLLERWDKLSDEQQTNLTQRIAGNVAARLKAPSPEPYHQLIFLQDVLTQTYLRMNRQLG